MAYIVMASTQQRLWAVTVEAVVFFVQRHEGNQQARGFWASVLRMMCEIRDRRIYLCNNFRGHVDGERRELGRLGGWHRKGLGEARL